MRKQKNDYSNRKTPALLLTLTLYAVITSGTLRAESENNRTSPPAASAARATVTTMQQQQQKITVSGLVKDNAGEPVIGANVVEKGATNGTTTDFDGHFTLTVAEGALLEISYIGYVRQEIPVSSNGESITVTLSDDTQMLDEIVITGFGLSQKKATLTGAISSVSATDIGRSAASTASGALVGKMSGINSVQKDGRPGASTTIEIRNMGTPLFVIDGIQSDQGQFNNINFNDIESISILKDASASIYGMRASNGVVVVTTKKGARNAKNTVSINGYYGWQSPSAFPRPANAETYIRNYIQSETVQNPQRENYTYTREDYAKWQQGTEKGYVPFDWYDFIFQTGPQYYLNANVTGGSEKSNYYISVGHLNQDAMIVNYGGFNRTNIQMNIDTEITNRLRIGASLNGRIEERVNPGVPGGDDYWLPRFGVFRNLPTRRPFANDNPDYPTRTSNEDGTNFGWLTYEYSGRFEEKWRVMQLQGNLEYDLLEGLTFKAMGGYYFAQKYMNNQEFTYKLYNYDPDTDTYPVISHNTNPWRERETQYVETLDLNLQLSYNRTFAQHTLAAVGGLEIKKRDNPRTWVHARPLANAQNFIDYQIMDTYDDDLLRTEARMGWLGRLNYDYANRYLLEASARYDGSWKFPPGHRWGFFPSGSVGWRISEEPFWDGTRLDEIFSDFKIRGSYGLMGDDLSDDNLRDAYQAFDYYAGYTYRNGNGAVLDGEYIVPSRDRGVPVTTMSWLETTFLDIGLDVGFLRNRLTGQLDFFRRKRTGLPARRYDILLPSEVGFDLPNENLNSDVHMGWDAIVRWRDRIGNLGYSIAANATYSRFYDWEQYKPRFGNSWHEYRNSLHHRFGHVNWGLEAVGQFQDWDEIASYPIDNDRQGNRTIRPGDIKYKDVNGDNTINGMDERPIGYRMGHTPTMNYGINLAADWNGFDLAFDLTGGFLASWFQEWEQRNPFHDGGNNAQYYMDDTWRLADIWDAESQLIPGKYPMLLIGNSAHSNYWRSTFWMHNLRYIKLRNIELGYTVPKQLVNRAGISDMRLYVGGSNIFTLTNIKGVDPESDQTNGLGYPTMRVINVGINLKF
jgi:TonB-linked SusC/RagA family outer membrane protein